MIKIFVLIWSRFCFIFIFLSFNFINVCLNYDEFRNGVYIDVCMSNNFYYVNVLIFDVFIDYLFCEILLNIKEFVDFIFCICVYVLWDGKDLYIYDNKGYFILWKRKFNILKFFWILIIIN